MRLTGVQEGLQRGETVAEPGCPISILITRAAAIAVAPVVGSACLAEMAVAKGCGDEPEGDLSEEERRREMKRKARSQSHNKRDRHLRARVKESEEE